ncbi:AIM24 family protein [Joostella atrarenae]|uniref:AIM24 family protein n=1 Tax=Joostella atrarenae TaxID=679257 RepID=A0ABS9J6E4_9FLAO|nr:AIM24 family protein [Joostella atrarenae]MCF8715984.1 AIM24 family protein [Joostella atrarenae]
MASIYMKTTITCHPYSHLKVELNELESIIVERGALIFSDGDYKLITKSEAKTFNNWIGIAFGGKSIIYNQYNAKEKMEMLFSPNQNAEIFEVEISNQKSVIISPDAHFARTNKIELKIIKQNWRAVAHDGLKMKASGEGQLFLIGYGEIINKKLSPEKEYLIDEDYLVAYDSHLNIKRVSRGLKELVSSGEGFLYSIKGDGEIWLQTRDKDEMSSSGGIINRILSFFY